MPHQAHPQTFCIDDLLNELQIEVKEKLQNAGKSNIDVNTFKYRNDHTCSILADRERLRQALVHLLDDSVKYTDVGFIFFGYYVMDTNLVDFFVDDTREMCHASVPDLSPVRDLLEQMGSRLKKSAVGLSSSLHFSIKSERVEVTKLA